MNNRFSSSLPRTTLIIGLLCGVSASLVTPAVRAQDLPPAATGTMSESAPISEDRLNLATNLISEALTTANQNPATRSLAVRSAAALIPRLSGTARTTLFRRWMNLANSPELSPETRSQAISSFFDVAATSDSNFAYEIAKSQPRPADRAAGFLALSGVFYHRNWDRSNEYVLLAQRAARQEVNPVMRARTLAFVSQQMAIVNPVERPGAVREASTAVRRLINANERDYLMAEVVTAAAKFDLKLARNMAGSIGDDRLRNVATARANLAEISQSTLTEATAERIAKLATASARYDQRALPILLQLPGTPDVFRALSDALPPIYPSATPSISPMLLERMWKFTESADPSVFRDQLQSRLARLMVLQDLWRGRAWGQQLVWKGGRIQVGAFLKEVIEYRQSALRVDPLRDVAKNNVQRAINEARALSPMGKVEALLLIAGQILG